MKLAYWMYAGPAHIGTLRVGSSFKNVHCIMHCPLGDDYFNVMRSMFERERDFTPVTTSLVDRHVLARGSREKVFQNIIRKDKEEAPDFILLTPTCTSSILQEDLQTYVNKAALESQCDVLLADVNHYRVNELQAADRTLEQIVRFSLEKAKKYNTLSLEKTTKPSVNIIGILTLGFHNQHDAKELRRLLNDLGIEVNLIIPEGASTHDLKNLTKAWFNLVPYRECIMTAHYLENEFQMPYVDITPMGLAKTAACIKEISKVLKKIDPTKDWNFDSFIDKQSRFVSQASWFARSIDSQNLTSKKAVVFGDATHAAAMTQILVREMGISVPCAGTYCKHDADWFREQVFGLCDEVLITDDHTQVADRIAAIEPSAIFGTQMERHVGKRLEIPCGVISAPVHIQNFPLGYRPFLGYEGTNQIADCVYNSFTLGMEDHLLEIFNGHDTKKVSTRSLSTSDSGVPWTDEALVELKKIPGFVRNKVKMKTENFALKNKVSKITVEVMYSAKEAVGA
uniref:protochlorophyllide reductase subunit B n=1 Tax=Hydrocytium acuminatum TaxID=1745963 RepID=UPI002A840932|nr:protochlorophyllide reductase subunit B [Hydrocytium acuminatum]WOR09581.1 protochlorophyllide reductase subunit B [Hydrocytium acuminatum]